MAECEKKSNEADGDGEARGVLDEMHEEVEKLRETRVDYAETTDDLRTLVEQLKQDQANL